MTTETTKGCCHGLKEHAWKLRGIYWFEHLCLVACEIRLTCENVGDSVCWNKSIFKMKFWLTCSSPLVVIDSKDDDLIVQLTEQTGVGPVDVDEQLHSSEESRHESFLYIRVIVFCPVAVMQQVPVGWSMLPWQVMVTQFLLENSWHFENRFSQMLSVGNIQSSSGVEFELLLFPPTAKAIGMSKSITFLRIMTDTQRTAAFGKNSYSFVDSGPSCKHGLCLFWKFMIWTIWKRCRRNTITHTCLCTCEREGFSGIMDSLMHCLIQDSLGCCFSCSPPLKLWLRI